MQRQRAARCKVWIWFDLVLQRPRWFTGRVLDSECLDGLFETTSRFDGLKMKNHLPIFLMCFFSFFFGVSRSLTPRCAEFRLIKVKVLSRSLPLCGLPTGASMFSVTFHPERVASLSKPTAPTGGQIGKLHHFPCFSRFVVLKIFPSICETFLKQK